MKNKGNELFTSVIAIIICIVCGICVFFNFKTAQTNDIKNVIYKNLTTIIEYPKGAEVNLITDNKIYSLTKTVVIRNAGEDDVYADFVWKNIDTNFNVDSTTYKISGKSLNNQVVPATKEGKIPLVTTEGLLMGELIKSGDTVEYSLTFGTDSKSVGQYMMGNLGINIRN